ncbi:hypothetical protein [Arenibacter algicola]|uniref:hypothetical protein n=1 Tax=Arenibacter algicola TaxID=616991 RepID=UPI0004DEE88F|nr:hypothetical protein [Arenibacter algicola]
MFEKEDKKEFMYNKDLLDDYINYLLRLFQNEDSRLNIIENKVSQLISQSGLIISIISFIIPLFYDKLNCLDLGFKIVLGLMFVLTIIFLGLSIFKASGIFKIYKFKYSDSSVETLKKNFEKSESFKEEYISDLIYSINNNKALNNTKGSILIWANRFFIYGIYSLILLSFLLIIGYYFV